MKTVKEEFEIIYQEYVQDIFNIAYGYVKNKDDAKDIVQNSFIKLLNVRKTFNDINAIKCYLIRITINESINYLKSGYKKYILKDNKIIENLKEETYEENQALIDAINLLPIKYQTIIVLYYYDRKSIKEISEILKISEDAVKKRLERSRHKLKEIIERNN